MTRKTKLQEEIRRQEKYLASLSDQFTFSLFNAKSALESQRRSGYRTTAAAAREIVDNAIEAGADSVHVMLHAESGRTSVDAIAFIDDGSGMVPRMIRAALTWGSGVHLEDHEFIGKFGFGLPNSSINQVRRVEVYSRVEAASDFFMTYLDINEFKRDGIQEIPEPKRSKLPEWVASYLRRNKLQVDHGTVVVWVKPDRLSYRKVSTLKEHLLDDFGVVYRNLVRRPDEEGSSDSPRIFVEMVQVEPVDPLFLDPRGRYYEPPAPTGGPTEGGARVVADRDILVRYVREKDAREHHLERVTPGQVIDPEDPSVLAIGTVHLRIARFPVGFVIGKKGQAERVGRPQGYSRWKIRRSRRGISFVRANREIDTVDAFPRQDQDVAAGLGKWPLLQGYAYHWAVELSFPPNLDEAFGITNDKQSVRPIEDLWRILHEEDVDTLLRAENNWQTKERYAVEKLQGLERPDGPTVAELAAQAADRATGVPVKPHGRRQEELEQQILEAAKDHAAKTGIGLDAARKYIEDRQKRHRYRIEYFEDEHAPFYSPRLDHGQFVIAVNKRHAFFTRLYTEVLGSPAKDAIDVLLIALGRAELTVDDDEMALWYEVQRRDRWSPFLKDALAWLARAEGSVEEELDLQDEGDSEAA